MMNGQLVSLLLLLALAIGSLVYILASRGPWSFRAEYARESRARSAGPQPTKLLTAGDLATLPPPVRRYVEASGAVGQPRVRDFRLWSRGRIRSGPDEPWMRFTAEQHNFMEPPARFYLMDARRGGLPVDVFHAYRDGAAEMHVKLLSLVRIVEESGPDMTKAETVTLLNDVAVYAPGALVDERIEWEPIDERSAGARYTVGEHTVSAVLVFDESARLVDFVSDDRLAADGGGGGLVGRRWSTPLSDYASFGAWQAARRGEGRWHEAGGSWAYIELELLELRINGR